MKPRPTLLFYCQHSLGMGHLMRSIALTRALASHFVVTFVSGGKLPRGVKLDPDVRVVQLPPVGMDEDGKLVSRDGRRSLESAMADRQRMLWETYRAVTPNAIVVELFPFGRRKFRGELLPVLEHARSLPAQRRPVVCCSVRDILVGRKDAQADHDRQAAGALQRFFDAVLVHSDPAFAQLEESFTADVQIPVPLYYTGFVHDNPTVTRRAGGPAGSIIVSAGGGIVGEPLLRAVIEGHALPAAAAAPPLTVVAGPFLPESAWEGLQALVRNRPRVKLLRSVTNLAADFASAAGSISQCGYNTAMDLLASGVPALVVPYCTETEDEQLRRARRLESLGALRVVMPDEATPERMAEEMAALSTFQPAPSGLDLKVA